MQRPTLLILGIVGMSLAGCGAVNNLIPEIDNLAQLDNSAAEATVGSGRALISGNVSHSVTFPDRDLPQANKLKRLKLRQSLATSVQVTVPGGVYPATFSLRNITLQVRLSDGSRVAEGSATAVGPIVFTRDGSATTYQSAGPVEISNITFSSDVFTTTREIITTAPSPNTAQGRLSFDTDSDQLPSGSVIRFTFINGKAKVEL